MWCGELRESLLPVLEERPELMLDGDAVRDPVVQAPIRADGARHRVRPSQCPLPRRDGVGFEMTTDWRSRLDGDRLLNNEMGVGFMILHSTPTPV